MLSLLSILSCAAGAAAAAVPASTNLFVSSYSGTITTLSLTQSSSGTYSLTSKATSNGCAPNPSWLTLDYPNQVLYCLDEGLTSPNGTLSSYKINTDGSLKQVQKANTISGPVAGAFYQNPGGQRAITLAHYTGSDVSSWDLTSNGTTGAFTFNQNIPFTLPHPGPNPARQDAPHEHEAIVDPTGQYILAPDLGADLVRVFSFDNSAKLTALTPLTVVPGSGPRHAVFYKPGGSACKTGTTYLFVVTELGNTVTSYEVTYLANKGGLSFKQVYESNTYGNKTLPVGNAPAEIAISPDNRFLVISNRNDSSFSITNPDTKNATRTIRSDTLSTFELQTNGSLSLVQLAPAGGSYPRQFAMNAAGDKLAVGLQYGSTVVVYNRDVQTGLLGTVAGAIHIDGQITCVRWDQETFDGTYANA